jgi:hypothetical protein
MSRNRGGRPRRDAIDIDFMAEDDEPNPVELVADHGIYFSADGRRRDEELHNISHKKRRVKPSELKDSFAEWIPVPDEDYVGGEPVAEMPEETVADSVLGKRKFYASSVSQSPLMVGSCAKEIIGLGQSNVRVETVNGYIPGRAAAPRWAGGRCRRAVLWSLHQTL